MTRLPHLAVLAAALLASAPALPASAAEYGASRNYAYNTNDWHGPGYVGRVEARASYGGGGYLPHYVKEERARTAAIGNWKAKVANIYGERFAHWRTAEGKWVNCNGAAGTVSCTASAKPMRAWSRWGWSHWGGWRASAADRY